MHLNCFRETIPDVPIMALTATAVPRVQTDILTALLMRQDTYKAQQTFDRPNLEISIRKKAGNGTAADLAEMLAKLKARPKESSIVYCPSRAKVDDVTAYLQAQVPQCNVMQYHAGMSANERDSAHRQFLTGRCRVIVATVAFGMGIDKPIDA